MLAVLATGCGGASAAEDEQRIRTVVTEAFTSADPTICTRLMTRAFVEQREFRRGRAAVKGCEAGAKDDPKSAGVKVRDVSVQGDRGAAQLTHTGPEATFSPITVALRRTGDGWKLDRVTALTLDRERFMRASGRDLSPAIAGCVMREYRLLSDGEIEQAVVRTRATSLFGAVVLCSVEPELRRTDLPPAVVTCAVRGLRARLRDGRLARLLGEDAASIQEFDQDAFERELRQVTGRCVGRHAAPA